ncbi:hypothetical protein Rhopal_002598-T1 [Rhodotorula paludigena]|uniref:Uncharacterized protein n=1 Tax=Rhodotorula paludigena TaxID=86838 RepID=A0AAV5GAI7_9BASI|nr:hypothetical protein Rhopal_002598-T1 [Rhodotorula paludigena]
MSATQVHVGPSVGADEPRDAQLPSVVQWILDKPSNVLHCDKRELVVDTSKASLVRDAENDNEPAVFLMVGRTAYPYLTTVGSSYGQWSTILTAPTLACQYVDGFDALKSKLEDIVGTSLDINARAATDLRINRYHADFNPVPPSFPNLFRYSGCGALGDAPVLDDVSTVSSRSVVACAFTAKVYEKRSTDLAVSQPAVKSQDEQDVEPGKDGKRGKGKKASKESPTKEQTTRAPPKSFGVRFELVALYYLGTDSSATPETSPVKVPRL